MAKELAYSLGLATTGFLGPLTVSRAALAGFAAATAAAGGVAAGVFREINRGSGLKELSNRTGETVRDLFQLQYAFEQSGVAAGAVGGILQKYRQALSGIGEAGESTGEAFNAIGLSIDELKKLDAPQALQKIFDALSQADRNTAAGAAGLIFGRGGAGEMQQIARDGSSFADALKESAAQAAVFDRMAATFKKIGDNLASIRLQIRGVFANLAADVGPLINGIVSSIASRDFATLGKIAELSLTVGFEKSVNFLANALARLFAALPELGRGARM